jgi:hypothetical protein
MRLVDGASRELTQLRLAWSTAAFLGVIKGSHR